MNIMNFIERTVEKEIQKSLFQGKVILLYGARQVGKTTLVKKILGPFGAEGRYLHGEDLSVQRGLEVAEGEKLRSYLGNYKLIVIDEAQHIPDIGLKLKLLIDLFPDLQIIATGSSSFELANRAAEPLTGRMFVFTLYPVSLGELRGSHDWIGLDAMLEERLRFGSYPEIIGLSDEEGTSRLQTIVSSYLYRDILQMDGIQKSAVLKNLVQLVALQLGQEVSSHELARHLEVSRQTVERYLDILEKSFVLFRLRPLARNARKEVGRTSKIYFFDVGVRNAIIQNHNPLSVRTDVGALWENFCIVERLKKNAAARRFVNAFFWRTYDQKEVDYVEESGGEILGFEFKWNEKKGMKVPVAFTEGYHATVQLVNRANVSQFLG